MWTFDADDQAPESEYLERLHEDPVPFIETELDGLDDDAREALPPGTAPRSVRVGQDLHGHLRDRTRGPGPPGPAPWAGSAHRVAGPSWETRMERAVDAHNKALEPFEPFAQARAKVCVRSSFRTSDADLHIEQRDHDERGAAIRGGDAGKARSILAPCPYCRLDPGPTGRPGGLHPAPLLDDRHGATGQVALGSATSNRRAFAEGARSGPRRASAGSL
jgi:hypothetical protein